MNSFTRTIKGCLRRSDLIKLEEDEELSEI